MSHKNEVITRAYGTDAVRFISCARLREESRVTAAANWAGGILVHPGMSRCGQFPRRDTAVRGVDGGPDVLWRTFNLGGAQCTKPVKYGIPGYPTPTHTIPPLETE